MAFSIEEHADNNKTYHLLNNYNVCNYSQVVDKHSLFNPDSDSTGNLLFHDFVDMEAQRGQVIYSRSHS